VDVLNTFILIAMRKVWSIQDTESSGVTITTVVLDNLTQHVVLGAPKLS
jgi:hypothetical protein